MDLAINNARNAILFTDERGTILICNQNAQQLFLNKIHDHLTQHSIFEIMDAPAVQQLYTEHIPARNVILDLVSGQHILSGYPIYLRKNVTNVMVTLDSIEWIQKKELHIRQALSEKGFTAKHHFSDMVSRSERFNCAGPDAKRFARPRGQRFDFRKHRYRQGGAGTVHPQSFPPGGESLCGGELLLYYGVPAGK